MKRILIFLLSALSLTVYAQQKKVAVYVTGNDPINDIIGSRLVDGIARSGKYIAIERTASFLSELSKEQNYQSTGAVDDSEISRLGKQFGVDYVCVASAFDVWGSEKYISTRMIDVETAEVVVSSSSNGIIASSSQLITALNTLSDGLLSSFEQSKLSTAKKVAVYVSRTGNKDVDIILGDQLVAGFAQSGRYFAIERTQGFLNQLSKEQDYQHTGAVDDAELTRLGKQFGVHYVCIAKTSQLFGDYFISTRLIDVETAIVVNSWNLEGAQLSNAQGVVTAAQEIAGNLSGRTTIQEQQFQIEEAKRIEARRKGKGLVDLGLPSGTLWNNANEGGDYTYYTYDEAINRFGNKLPTKQQWEELKNICTWTWDGNRYIVIGPNGNSIMFYALGYRNCEGGVSGVGTGGYYWTATPNKYGDMLGLQFGGGGVGMRGRHRCDKLSVRLVQNL